MSNQERKERNYQDGWNDGKAHKIPEFDRLNLGGNSLNDYERGYIDSGRDKRGEVTEDSDG